MQADGTPANGAVPASTETQGSVSPFSTPAGSQIGWSRHLKVIGAAALVLVILVGALAFIILHYGAPAGTHPPVTAFSHTLTSRQDALYGIPAASAFVAGISNSTSNIYAYGLNFTFPFTDGFLWETPPDLIITPPKAYANAAYPVAVVVHAIKFSSAGAAAAFFSSSLYNYTFDNAVDPAHNYSVQAYLDLMNGTVNVFKNTSFNEGMYYRSTLTFNKTEINGVPVVIDSLSPIYTNAIEYQPSFLYHDYVVTVLTLGINGQYNTSYAMNIVRNMISQLQSQSP